jgi:serine/threonine protein kinase
MALTVGTPLGSYEITGLLGKGGMGEVYRALDTRLKREVAVKILPEEFSRDADRILRFQREAELLASLNHPNIANIYALEEQASARYLILELVEGDTLAGRIANGPSPTEEVQRIAIQICEALEAAHSQGIIHRDLKPANIKIRPDGKVKLLDFGLAKALEKQAFPVVSSLPTAVGASLPGAMVGTPGYMSPEQARGENADERSDLFATGLILYQMVAGRHPFERSSLIDLMHAVMHDQPPALSASVPHALRQIIDKAILKDPAQRYQSASHLHRELKDLSFGSEPEPSSKQTPSIAVLPFVNISNDPENEYFCDGLAEELLNGLSKIQSLRVAARTSTFFFKGKGIDIRQVAQKLNVGAVLEGSVRKAGDRLRITVQLINADDGYHLWSEKYDRKIEDIFDIQEEISLSIVEALKLQLLGHEKKNVLKRGTDDKEVYQLYLKGRYFWNKRTDKSLKDAIECFQQAIDLDPNYALAWAGLADSWAYRGYAFGLADPFEAMPKAKAAAARARELDETLAEAHLSIALTRLLFDWDWPGAESAMLRSLELNPRNPSSHHFYAIYLAAVWRRFDDAIVEARKGLDLDPLSVPLHNIVALLLLNARRFEEAIAVWRKLLQIDGTSAGAWNEIAWAFELQGQYDQAAEAYVEAMTVSGESERQVEAFRQVFASSGIDGLREWKTNYFLQKWEQRNHWHSDAYSIAVNCARQGDNDQALAWLETAFRARSGLLVWLRIQAAFDPLRDDPRFVQLLRRVGFPE